MFGKTIAAFVAFIASVAVGLAEPAGADAASIGQLLRGLFGKPGEPLSVGPVVVSRDHAIADWAQGEMGGRALLRRKQGAWAVTLCAGDAIKSSEALKAAGVPQPDAIHLAQALASAESGLAPERVAVFARFEGLVTMDATSGHAGHSR
ncbi:copper uptake system-associated protein [Bradyrhizobium sp.]|jgi:hypothetical protein|uniref:copper uptake system-associated protein n=1 Tax=Bradyrhizobium sp. TaxID=376 RepID=UPI002CD2511F|nr:copper uptake system-associated protein [Bradyrhizobium sp.]HMM91321.1 copper uptake system-associated protein [Bradyrhizobium sp.]